MSRTDSLPAGALPVPDGGVALHVQGPEGAPVLVLGHSLGSSHVMWDEVAALLARDLRVVCWDLPGHGGAPLIGEEGRELTMTDVVDALRLSLDASGVGDFHVAGLSFGGLASLAVAADMPDRVRSVAVMASGPRNGTRDGWAERAALVRREGTGALADATMERWFTPDFRTDGGTGEAWVDRIRAVFTACEDEGYARVCEVLGSTDLRPHLARIAAPALVVNGSDDAFDDAAADELAGALTRAASVDVLHLPARHMCAVEHPQRVADALRHLVERAELGLEH